VPELPDVEGFRRTFARHAAGKRLRAVHDVDRLLLRDTSPQALGRGLRGRRFAKPRRHGKLLLCGSDGPTLVLRFGMTGDLVWGGEPHPHDRLVLDFADGALRYRNMRRFGGIWLARDEADRSARSTATTAIAPTARSSGSCATRCRTDESRASEPG
jgi:formamidopyrimidine-DNA glycosylase